MPVTFLLARRRGTIALLSLPSRPRPGRPSALLAAIALPRPSRTKEMLTSFQQAPPGPGGAPRPARPPFPTAALLIFGMACSTLGRAQGRSLLPEAPAPEGIALLSGAQQIFGSIRDQQLYRKDRMPAALSLRRSLFPASGGAAVTPAGRSPSFPLKSVQVGWCPVTATQHWRCGPRWPAKMVPSPAAANS